MCRDYNNGKLLRNGMILDILHRYPKTHQQLRGNYPLVMTNIAIENGPVEIVDFPIDSMVDLSMAKCKRSPEETKLLNCDSILATINHY